MLHYDIAIKGVDIAVGEYGNATFANQRANEFTEPGNQTSPDVYIVTARRADIYSPVLHNSLLFRFLLGNSSVAQKPPKGFGIVSDNGITIFAKGFNEKV